MTKSPRLRSFAAALTLALVTLSAAPVGATRPAVTVGDFAVKLTRALGYNVDDESVAADTLRQAGVHIDADLGAPLTESRAGDMLREMGVPSSSSGDPSAIMSAVGADRAAGAAALQLSSQADGFTPGPETEQCRNVGDRPTCYNCCFSVLSPRVKFPIVAVLVCGLVCSRLFPPPSPSSPR
ncbi:MAG TPA: hypothetical protein VMQ62_06670 [Dongiaceae bacterium]|nr:hypothetical protein [Dongiaceae bacterium]